MALHNPLINSKNKDARKQDMMAKLTEPAIKNHSPSYHQMAPMMASGTKKQLVVVTLDKLHPYEGNPRKTKNPAYEEIKASIKARGLDHAPNVTQRPGEDFYTIADGGNTRLQALNELFKETQDPRFWSIECVFKPWQGEAEDINAKLNILIGHLAENDVRGDLSFIEKALGIREVKALYEEKYAEFFSHRKLAEKLGDNGYPISHSILVKMEQCLTYLYPHMPNILLNGLGKPQIEKLLAIHRNANASWDKYQLEIDTTQSFDEVWMHTLSPFDEVPENFVIADFQDQLITQISEAFGYQVGYETLKLEISLEERKRQRLMEKEIELAQRAMESEARVQELSEQQQAKTAELKIKPATSENVPEEETADTATVSTSSFLPQNTDTENEDDSTDSVETDDTLSLPSFSLSDTEEDDLTTAITQHFGDLGLQPGVNPEPQRQEEAVINGLEFANVGKQSVTNIWKIHPARKHKMEAYSLALDIAEEVGIGHLIEHVVTDPVDYGFKVNALDVDATLTIQFVHSTLSLLATAETDQPSAAVAFLDSSLLLGSTDAEPLLSDLLLVRLFRLIRLVRYIHAQARTGETQ